MVPVACRAEKEAGEQRKADLAAALERRKASKQAGLQAEPLAGTPNTAAVRIRLPDGSTAQRRFLADQPLQVDCALSACRLPFLHRRTLVTALAAAAFILAISFLVCCQY